MSDSLAYDLVADLADALNTYAAQINLPTDCDAPTRIYASAGAPDAFCDEIAVWSSGWGPTDLPNRDQGIDQTACASKTYIGVTWRLTMCISKSPDGTTPISVTNHEADAECFNTLAFALYRRVMVNLVSIFTGIGDCDKITMGALQVGNRQGGMLSASQSFRIAVDLTAPSASS